MELIFAIIFIAIAVMSENKKRQKKDREKMRQILDEAAKSDPVAAFAQTVRQTVQSGAGTTSSAFSQVKRQGTRAVFPSSDPGRVSAQQARQKHPSRPERSEYRSASGKNSPLMRKTVTRREKFERSLAYENSNLLDVQYTSNGCGCSTGEGNAASGSAHGRSSAIYDENRFFKESRKICAGKWS
jgi:hypothetical protein